MRVLIVDDEKNIRRTLRAAVETMNHDVTAAASGDEALEALRRGPIDVVLLDLRLSAASGLDLLPEILHLAPRAAVVIMTAFSSIESAVEAMRRGAFDYLPKPCTPDQIRAVLARIEKTRRLEGRVAELESLYAAEEPEIELASSSGAMQRVLRIAWKAAESEATVLLLGESGTGKSVLARAIHARSPRREHTFVTVSCPSLSRELLESELFGHVKGAFTGAVSDTWGKVAAAEGGTLFLDEIGEMPIEVQARLLRLLQEREYERIGETRPRRANIRLISATNRNLEEAVAQTKFREDLFYRLNVISIRLPPLRERPNDIPALAAHQLRALAARSGRLPKQLTPDAIAALTSYPWPGNIRELHNVIERAVILNSTETISRADLEETVQSGSEVRLGGAFTVEQIEAEHVRRVIERSRTLEEAAQILGIDRATLYRWRKK